MYQFIAVKKRKRGEEKKKKKKGLGFVNFLKIFDRL